MKNRQRETAPYRIMVLSVFAFIFLVLVGQIGVNLVSGLMSLVDSLILSVVFLLPVLLYYFMGKRQTVSVKAGIISALILAALTYGASMVYGSGNFIASLFVFGEGFSILSFGRWLPPSDYTEGE